MNLFDAKHQENYHTNLMIWYTKNTKLCHEFNNTLHENNAIITNDNWPGICNVGHMQVLTYRLK